MFMKANDYYVLISPCLMSESRQFSITKNKRIKLEFQLRKLHLCNTINTIFMTFIIKKYNFLYAFTYKTYLECNKIITLYYLLTCTIAHT